MVVEDARLPAHKQQISILVVCSYCVCPEGWPEMVGGASCQTLSNTAFVRQAEGRPILAGEVCTDFKGPHSFSTAPSTPCASGAHAESACYCQNNRPKMFRLRSLQSLGFDIKAAGLAAAAVVGDKVWNQTQTSQNFTAILVPCLLSLQGACTLQCSGHQSSLGLG